MRYFTYIVNGRRVRRQNQHCHGVGLYFGSDNHEVLTAGDIKSLAESPELHALLGDVFYVQPIDNNMGVVVTVDEAFNILPEAAQSWDETIGVQLGTAITPVEATRPIDSQQLTLIETTHVPASGLSRIYSIRLRQHYDACTSLFKRALGCGQCPDKGRVCLSKALPADVVWLPPKPSDSDAWIETLKSGKSQIAGFTYVSPVMTRSDLFDPNYRSVDMHDFGLVADNFKTRSEASTTSAEYKRFQKNECSKCPLVKSCERYRRCEGRYPPEEEITKYVLAEFEKSLKKSKLTRQQVYAIAYATGATSYGGVSGRRAIELTGIVKVRWSRDGHEPGALVGEWWYAKRPAGVADTSDDYDALKKMFSQIRDEERQPSDLAVALWYMSLDEHSRRHRAYCGYVDQPLAARHLNDLGVMVRYANSREIFSYRPSYLIRYRDYYDKFNENDWASNPIAAPRAADRKGRPLLPVTTG